MGSDTHSKPPSQQAAFEALRSTLRAAMDVKNARELSLGLRTLHEGSAGPGAAGSLAEAAISAGTSIGWSAAPSSSNRGALPADVALGPEDIPRLVALIRSENEDKIFEAVSSFRKMISKGDDDAPIDQVMEAGVLDVCVELLTSMHPKIVFEALWVLTNIASGETRNCEKVAESGAIPIALDLLSHHQPEVQCQAVWLIGNVAGDSATCRNIVLASGALSAISRNLNPDASLDFVSKATWAISNCLRGHPTASPEAGAEALPMLAQLLYSEDTGKSHFSSLS
jgi:Armadillo/beta-catenin-like repeat